MIKLKKNAFQRYKKTRLAHHKRYYLDLKHVVNTAISNEKNAYYKYEMQQCGKNSKLIWNKVQKHKIINNSYTEIPNEIKDPNLINDHFLNSIPKIPIGPNTLSNFLQNQYNINEPFKISLITPSDILTCINDLKSNAIGADNISAKMLKLSVPHCLGPLVNIINYSLETGIVPHLWKIALVTPIPKKDDPTINDLRPISILPAPSKILERVVNSQLVDYLNSNKILPTCQSGFRKGFSCTTALLKITDDITRGFDNGQCTPLVLIDMSKAFDSLNIELLLAKLSFYKITNVALDWFSSYLLDRQQAVRLCKQGEILLSDFKTTQTGVPQGSILGPLLFSVYTADIGSIIQNCSVHMYADDLQIYLNFSTDSLESINLANLHLNQDLQHVYQWATDNSLVINPIKSQAIMFSRSRFDTNNFNIKLNNNEIEWKESVSNLGLIMDTKLNFDKHVSKICQSSFFKLKSIYEFRDSLPITTKLMLSDMIVLSVANYMDVVYGPYLTVFNTYRLQKIQNSCIRFVMSLSRREHTSQHIRASCWLTMEQRRLLHMSCLIHKILKTNTPTYLRDLMIRRRELHNVEVRNNNMLSIPQHNTEFYKNCFSYQAAHIFNKMTCLHNTTISTTSFKKQAKDFILHM